MNSVPISDTDVLRDAGSTSAPTPASDAHGAAANGVSSNGASASVPSDESSSALATAPATRRKPRAKKAAPATGTATKRRAPSRKKAQAEQVPVATVPPPPLTRPDGSAAPVVHLAGELSPYARTGGLGEAVASLAKYQAASGIPVTVIMPLYAVVRERVEVKPLGPAFAVTVGPRTETARLYEPVAPHQPGNPRIVFVENEEYFDRPGLYGDDLGDYPDNARRYALFARAVLVALPRIMPQAPSILHAHDWQTALAAVYLKAEFAAHSYYEGIRAVLSVHNAGYQGHFPESTLAEIGLPYSLYNHRQLEWWGRVNVLKGGLVFSDLVITVSPTHAHELRTEKGGFGLDGVFVALRDRLVGIVNGIDQEIWDPSRDTVIPRRFTIDNLSGKKRCRLALQRAAGLSRWQTPIFALTARLVAQKGLDLILGDPGYFAFDAQYVFLGHGEARYEEALTELAERAPSRIAVKLDFTDEFEHLLLAGADMCLMPSQYEPCGLTQMRAQRYGTIPVARRVGGLADTIEDGVTGFLFDDYTPADFMRAANRAVDQFHDAEGWGEMMREAMSRDFGWERSASRYLSVYRRVLGLPSVRQDRPAAVGV
ncbi:MAG TPA: glycogen/starch synthase [Gemmatimonadaceae bacterium]|jgi:starch synthase|nr:glycogen/starch synthase [Gemmatimonadaceae bacterium]